MAMEFNGSNQYLNRVHDAILSPTGSFYFEAILKPDTVLKLSSIISKGWDLALSYDFRIENTGKIRLLMRFSGGGGFNTGGTNSLSVGTWHHVIATYDRTNNEVRYYLDGSLDTKFTSITGTPVTNTNDLRIGRYKNSYLNGTLAMVSMGSFAISDSLARYMYATRQRNMLRHASTATWHFLEESDGQVLSGAETTKAIGKNRFDMTGNNSPVYRDSPFNNIVQPNGVL